MGTLQLGKVDEQCWVIEHSGEPWVGDWIAKDRATEYETKKKAVDKNEMLGHGGRYYVYEAFREANDQGEPGYRLTDKL